MDQFSPQQLLMLLVLPIVGALLFASILVVSLIRWISKRNKRELDAQSALLGYSSDNPLATSRRDSRPITLPPAEIDELDTSILSRPATNVAGVFPADPADNAGTSTEASAALPGSNPTMEVSPTMTKQTEERLNLAARLGAVRPAAPPTSDMVELLRLLRDPQSGQLVVEVAGQRYIRLTEVTDKKIGQYILKLVAHLLVFTNGMIATEGGVKSIYLPKMSEVPEPPVESLPAAGSPEPLAPPTGRPATPEPPSSPPPVIPSLPAQPRVGPLSAPRRPPEPAPEPARRGLFGRPKPAPEAKLPPLNLAAQINDIAQNRLAMSPLASRTWLEITTDPGGGIRINVNGTVYSSPDEIPDPEVKELIKASIKQWERS